MIRLWRLNIIFENSAFLVWGSYSARVSCPPHRGRRKWWSGGKKQDDMWNLSASPRPSGCIFLQIDPFGVASHEMFNVSERSVILSKFFLMDLFLKLWAIKCFLCSSFPMTNAHKSSKRCLDSNKESILSIAFWVLSRTSPRTLHCPCPESYSMMFHCMGCKHSFVAHRITGLLDEIPNLLHEDENFQLVSQLRVAIQTRWSRCPSPRAAGTSVHQRVACSISICVFVCVFVSLYPFNKQLGALAVKRWRVLISWALERDVFFYHNKSFCLMNWIWAWLGAFRLSSNFSTQFLTTIVFKGSSEAFEVIQILNRL